MRCDIGSLFSLTMTDGTITKTADTCAVRTHMPIDFMHNTQWQHTQVLI